MNDRPITFRVCDFSEQIVRPKPGADHSIYSAVLHVDGRPYHFLKAIRPEFSPPLSNLRSEGWLALLEQVAEGKQ